MNYPLSRQRFLLSLMILTALCCHAWAQNNTPPKAEAGGPYVGVVGQSITFDGSASYDPDKGDKIIHYEWDLDDDGKYEVQGVTVSKTFYSPTSGTVHLRVWDTRQASDTDSVTYKVKKNQSPVADAGGPYWETVGHTVTLDGSGSYDPDGKIVGWHWDLDDDGQYDDAFGKVVSHTWDKPYSGTVHLRVIDAQQAWDTDSASVTIVKPNKPPTANAGGPYWGTVGQSIKLDGSLSTDPDDSIIHWDWDLDNDGDFSDASGEIVWVQWDQPYAGQIGLRVTDSHNASDTDWTKASIQTPVLGKLGGTIFHDRNRNGKQEQGEEGLGGWTLYLDLNRNGKQEPNEKNIQSQKNGSYLFTDLEEGKYRIAIVHEDETWKLIAPTPGYHETHVINDQTIAHLGFAFFKTLLYDYGDAPDPNFPTRSTSDGARHRITADSLCLGYNVDPDGDGQPHIYAIGDDFDEGDDEDGIVFRSIIEPGAEVRLDLTLTNRQDEDQYATIGCWVDTNGNGQWDLPEELLDYWLLTALPGTHTWDLPLAFPPHAEPGSTFARFRLFVREDGEDTVVLSPQGSGGLGEVEDYHIVIMEPGLTYDFGDAPFPYPTLLPDGAWHSLWPGLGLGIDTDNETNGQPDPSAAGDGTDEDGVSFPDTLAPGGSASVNVQVLNGTAVEQRVVVSGWIDFDGNGSWDMDEHVTGLSGRVLPPYEGAIAMNRIDIPLSARPGRSYARYRLYASDPNSGVVSLLAPSGFGGRGEVEDYIVEIGEPIITYTTEEPTPPGGQWERGEPNGSGGAYAGNPDPENAHADTEVFGVNLDGDYDTTVGGPYYLELGPFRCVDYAQVTVRYFSWLNSGPEVRNTVEIRNSDMDWSPLWVSPPDTAITDSSWQYYEFDITEWAACHPQVYLRFGYEILAEGTPYSGWNIDDLRLLGSPNELVPFADINLKAAVLNRLVEMGASDFSTPPTFCQMLQLTSLDISELDIRQLGGLEYARNLEDLNANDNLISDLAPLEQLTNLTQLRLRRNQIIDIRPLANLTNLIHLDLAYNEIARIAPLGRMTVLTHLYLEYNQIAGLEALDWGALSSGFTVLNLSGNLIANIDPLANLGHLWSLILSNNQVNDIGILAGFPDTRRLTLNGNLIEDIDALREHRNLIYLNLRNNELNSDACTLLEDLRLANPDIELVTPDSCGP